MRILDTQFSISLIACMGVGFISNSEGSTEAQDPPPVTPNILVVLLDDVGIDSLRLYTSLLGASWTGNCAFESQDSMPCLDVLEEVARHGLAFTEAWANPTCSATRAALLTGRYGFRTGIGKMISPGGGISLCDDEELLPELLGSRYSCGAFGKWHLSNSTDPFDSQEEGYPWMNGFDHFEGQLHAVKTAYCSTSGSAGWLEVESSPTLVEQSPDLTGYLVEEHFRDAQAWIQSAAEPWFCFLAPQAPFQLPWWPPQQYTGCSPMNSSDSCLPAVGGSAIRRAAYDVILEAADSFLGDILGQLNQQAAQIHPTYRWWDTTTIFLIGDNGSPGRVARLPFGKPTAKETLFEGGVRVPFIVAGWGVAPARWGQHSAEMVNVVDVFSTICSLTQTPLPQRTIDGVNLRPYLRARPAAGLRTFSYAEKWHNPKGVCWQGGNAVDRVYRSTTYGDNWKIHYAKTRQSCVFYDLIADPCEQVPFLWDDPVVVPFQAGLWAEVSALVDKDTCDSICQ